MSDTSAEIVLGTPKGFVRAQDICVISDPEVKWSLGFVLNCATSFEQYFDPSEQLPEGIVTSHSAVVHGGLPRCQISQ